MLAVFFAEFTTSNKYTIQQLAIAFVVATLIAIAMQNIFSVAPVVILMAVFSRTFTLGALDEQNHWQNFRAALPLSRDAIMGGRLLAIGAIILMFALLSLIISVLLIVVVPPLAAALGFEFSTEAFFFDWELLLLGVTAALFIAAVIELITLPLMAKFGMTQAIRYIPLVCAVLVIGFFMVLPLNEIELMAANWENVFYDNLWPIVGIFALLALGIYAVTTLLSMLIYRTRQFK